MVKTKEIMHQPYGKTMATGKAIGGFLGKVNALAVIPMNAVDEKVSTKGSKFTEENISSEIKHKWSNVKGKSNNINDKVSNVISPIVKGYYNL